MPKRDLVLVAFGQNLRCCREAQKLSQADLAECADLDRTYISDIERGLRNPGIKNVVKLAQALGVRSAKLMEGVDA